MQCVALLLCTVRGSIDAFRISDVFTSRGFPERLAQLATMSSKHGTVSIAAGNFAFVHVGAGERDVYVPRPVLDAVGGLKTGQRVAFEAVNGPLGPVATKVTRSL